MGIWIGIVLGVFGIDTVLKQYMEKKLPDQGSKPIAGGRLLLRKYHNKGAMLDMGSSRRKLVRAVSLILTILATLLFLSGFRKKGMGLQKLGLSLLLGGALSNTSDRCFRGYVVDYLSFAKKGHGRFDGVVYNVSDFAIMAGAVFIVLSTLRSDKTLPLPSDENLLTTAPDLSGSLQDP